MDSLLTLAIFVFLIVYAFAGISGVIAFIKDKNKYPVSHKKYFPVSPNAYPNDADEPESDEDGGCIDVKKTVT